MAEHTNSRPPEDSLDRVERIMAMEEALNDPDIAPEQREQLMREIKAWILSGEFGDEGDFMTTEGDFDDDYFAALVRKLGPRSPRGQAGAAAEPEDLFFD